MTLQLCVNAADRTYGHAGKTEVGYRESGRTQAAGVGTGGCTVASSARTWPEEKDGASGRAGNDEGERVERTARICETSSGNLREASAPTVDVTV